MNTNYGDYCGFCGGERREEWTGYPAEYPEFKPSKQCKTEVTESSLPLKLELLLPQPDDTTCCQLNSIAIAQERAKKFLGQNNLPIRRCVKFPLNSRRRGKSASTKRARVNLLEDKTDDPCWNQSPNIMIHTAVG